MEKKKSTIKKKRRKSSKKSQKSQIARLTRRIFRRYKKYVIAGFAALLLLILIIVGAKSCGVKHNTPEGVVKSLIEAYFDGKQGSIRDCYGVKQADDNLQKEIDATIKYFDVHNAKELIVDACDVIYKDSKNAYVYIVYSMELENGQLYPSISTYMTELQDDKYYVLPTANVTSEMSELAADAYAEFMQTDPYKDYVTAYDTFIKKNPGYEDRIAGKLM